MPFKIIGNISGNVAEVDNTNNLLVRLPSDPSRAGLLKMLDSDGNSILTTENGALSVSNDSLLLFDQVDGAALNTNVWTSAVSTMTVAQSAGYINLNAGASLATNAYALISSIRYVPLYGHLPVRITVNAKVSVLPEANATIEFGIGSVATNAAPTDGAFFRWTPAAQLQCVINNAGVETPVTITGTFTEPDGDSTTVPPVAGERRLYDIVIFEDLVQFRINDVLVAEVSVPIGNSYPTGSGRLPIFARVYNGGSAPSQAPVLSIGQVVVVQQATNQIKPWSDVLAGLGRGAYQSPVTPFGQTANHANSASPTSATLSNTASGYATLGGRYQFATLAGAVTDYALFAFQVPAGYQLYVTGVTISALNTGAAVATTASVLDWSLGVNASAVSLATVDGAGTWAPRRITLGAQSFIVGAAIGVTAPDINRRFEPPLVVDSGRFLHVAMQLPIGTATASQVIRGDVMIHGYFE